MASKKYSITLPLFSVWFCNILLSILFEAKIERNDYMEIQASGRGNSRAEATKNTMDKTLRKNMGTVIKEFPCGQGRSLHLNTKISI